MGTYQHKKLIETILRLDVVPDDRREFDEWIKAGNHLNFLENDQYADEIVIFASGPYTFVHSMVVPNVALTPVDEGDLLGWNCNPFSSTAGYASGGGGEGIWVERNAHSTASNALDKGIRLVFGRTFEGWSGPDSSYFELHQEYVHLTGIHWRPEHKAYCRFDDNGDLEQAASITRRDDSDGQIALVSFIWEPLEEYLAASDSSLVRMYDFTMFRPGNVVGWPDGPEQIIHRTEQFFYRQKVAGQAAYTRGVQIIGWRRPKDQIFKDMLDSRVGKRNKQYVEFIAHDWRHNCIARLSTDPSETTNYFDAKENDLPFELSPAFFRPEVLLKYKTDRDKYTVGEREVSCRAAWHLRGIDVNEAGQVHAYICYLRSLPYSEQLHWKSFNEDPKAVISERALTHDFKGEWASFPNPLGEVLSKIRRWNDKQVSWWTLRDSDLIQRVSLPLTASRDEWAEAFMDLAKLVNEGFEVKEIRSKLREADVEFDKAEGSIVLLERWINRNREPERMEKLEGLRAVQRIRSEVKGHAGNRSAKQLSQDALTQHESFAKHFQHICAQVAHELDLIEAGLT